jgi:hypothetical protein
MPCADETLFECRFGAPFAAGDRTAVKGGSERRGRRGDACRDLLIRFGGDGRVVEQRDYWSMQGGRYPANF